MISFYHKRLITYGGAEIVLIQDLTIASKMKRDVELVSFEISSEFQDKIPSNVKVVLLKNSIFSFLHHYIWRKCPTIISSSGLVEIGFLTLIKKIKLILIDHHPTSLMPAKTFSDDNSITKKKLKFLLSLGIANEERPKTNNKFNIHTFIINQLHIRSYRKAHYITVLSEFGQLEKKFIYRKNATVVRTGLDLTGEISGERNSSEDIVCVQRLVKDKNLENLLYIVSNLKDSTFESRQLHIIGDGRMMTDLKVLSEKLGISQKVVFHGFLDNSSKNDLLSKCRYFINPQFADYNLTTIEALFSGCSVVTSHIADFPEITGKYIFGCDQRNVEDLSSAIIQMTTAKDCKDSEIDSLRYSISSTFSWNKRMSDLRMIINDL